MVRACMTALVLFGLVAAAQAQVTLTLKNPENTRSATQIESKTNQTMTIAGMDIETSSTSTMTVASASGARAEDGSLRVENNIESMQVRMDLPGGIQVNFHSDNPDAKAPVEQLEPFLALFRANAKTPWTIVFDEDDNITAIEGREKILDALDADTAKLVQAQFDQEYLLDEANRELEVIPVDPIQQGAVWELDHEQRLEGGQTLSFHKRYEYTGAVERDGRTLDRIAVTATTVTYSMDPNSTSPLKVTNSNLAVAASEGEILFDREAGHVAESHEKVQVAGDMTFSINGMNLPGKLDLTIESTVKRQP